MLDCRERTGALSIEKVLRTHQVEPFKHLSQIIRSSGSAVDWSDMGTGKTFVACGVAASLSLPTLVICPDIARTAWTNSAAAFGEKISVIGYEMLRTGRSPYGTWEHPLPKKRALIHKCVNCQIKYRDGDPITPCYTRPDGIHGFETKVAPHNYGKFIFHDAVGFTIFDEVHRCNALDSLNADILIAAKRQRKYILGLSATAAESPLHFRALGYVLDLHRLADFYNWAARYHCRRVPRAGFKWMVGEERQRELMADIRSKVIPSRGVRVTTASIPNFPKRVITSELYDLKESGRIDELYQIMGEALAELKNHAADDKDPDNPLTKMLRAHQEIELLKLPVMVEVAEDHRAKGFSVAMFVNYSQTLAELKKRLNLKCIIDGSPDGVRFRNRSIELFQSNAERYLGANIKAGGITISLQDLHGDFPRVGLVMPCHSAVDLRQVFGRLPRDGGKSTAYYKVLLAAGTMETKMHSAMRRKQGNIEALNDADLSPFQLA